MPGAIYSINRGFWAVPAGCNRPVSFCWPSPAPGFTALLGPPHRDTNRISRQRRGSNAGNWANPTRRWTNPVAVFAGKNFRVSDPENA